MANSYVALPVPQTDDPTSLEVVTVCPWPVRFYDGQPLAAEYMGQLLWAAYTVNNARQRNSVDRSAWLILYACCADGIWRYHPQEHCLTRHLSRDVRRVLADAASNRWFIALAPCVFVVTAVPKRGRNERCGEPRPSVEAGRAVERMLLQSADLGLASAAVSEFDSAGIKCGLVLSRLEEPLCLVPVGWPDQGC